MRRILSAVAWVTIVGLGLSGCGGGGAPQAQVTPTESVTLAKKVVKGLVYKSKNFISLNVGGIANPITIEEKIKTSVDSTFADGTTVRNVQYLEYSEVTYSGGQAIFNENSEKMIVGENLWLKVGPEGIVEWRGLEAVRARDVQGKSLRESMVLGAAGSFPYLPGKTVAIGESWAHTLRMDIASQYTSMAYTITRTYTLRGLATKFGYRCAKIGVALQVTANGSLGDASAEFEARESITGDGAGEIFYALDEGYFVTSKEDINLDITTVTRRGREEPRTEYSSSKAQSGLELVTQ
jgi:hypothetical protein